MPVYTLLLNRQHTTGPFTKDMHTIEKIIAWLAFTATAGTLIYLVAKTCVIVTDEAIRILLGVWKKINSKK